MTIKPWYAVPMDVLEALGGLKQDDPPILWTDGEAYEALHPVGSWGGRRGYFLLPPSTPALRHAVARAYDIRPETLISWRLCGHMLQIQHEGGLLQLTLTWGMSDEHEALAALACRLAGTNHAPVTLPDGVPRSGRVASAYLPPIEAAHMDHLTLRERCYNRIPAFRSLGSGQLAMPELLKLVAVDMFVHGVGTDQDLADEVRRQLSHLQTHSSLP